MKIPKILAVLTATFTLNHSFIAHSGQIILQNGDTLQGTVIDQTETYVTWKSDRFGSFKIPQNQIISINSSDTNPTPIAKSKNQKVYSGILGLSGSYLDGNEERDDLELDILLTLEQGNLTHNTEMNYETLGQENEATIKDYGIAYGIDWAIDVNWYWGNNIFYGADDKRQIEQSVSVGTNLGYRFWKNEDGKLSTEIGLAWINDKLFSSIDDERIALVWSGNYQKQLNKKVSLSYSHQLNVSMKDSGNTQLSADIGFIIPVTDKLATKISYDWSIDNQPEQGNEKIDRKLKFGADYSF
jgi:putative salt-induced outer membrane protein YdiY